MTMAIGILISLERGAYYLETHPLQNLFLRKCMPPKRTFKLCQNSRGDKLIGAAAGREF
jgi:hypothetical protein